MSFNLTLLGLAASSALLVAACGNGAGENACGSQSAAIYNGSSEPTELELDPTQRSAIVAIRHGAAELVCTGAAITTRWLLTAAHCEAPELVALVESRVLTPVKQVTHPELDVMLVELEAELDRAVEPIAPWTSAIDDTWIGAFATLAGLGKTESGATGHLLFAREPIVDVEPNELWVDGAGKTGACAGDSGGPLLVADGSGQARIAGVLDRGSPDCLGVDVYTRLDVLADWIQNTLDSSARVKPCP